MGRRLSVGDLHGGFKALIQCLKRANYDPLKDQLLFLGDVCDGWSETKQCVDFILAQPNYIYVMGNHCLWFRDYINNGCNIKKADSIWLQHGGRKTIESYSTLEKFYGDVPDSHVEFFKNMKPYHVTEDNILFIHAGYSPGKALTPQHYLYYIFNRDLVEVAIDSLSMDKEFYLKEYKEVFVGHTPTNRYLNEEAKPIIVGNLYMLDTAAAFDGVLTIMDVDTKEYWQSDVVATLYPDEFGRNECTYNSTK